MRGLMQLDFSVMFFLFFVLDMKRYMAILIWQVAIRFTAFQTSKYDFYKSTEEDCDTNTD